MRRILLWVAMMVGVLALVLALVSPGFGYLNLSEAGPVKSTVGPHQAINRCALRVWVEWQIGKGDFKRYKMPSPALMRKVAGKSFTNAVNFYPDLLEGTKPLSWGEWLQEGGYTADEPEIWQALRHFYDPTKPTQPWLCDPHAGLYATAWYWGTTKYDNPQMDAITWAIEGPAKNGQPANEYSWEKARGYMEAAWANTKSADEKDVLFGAGWRAVGETMHLVADMTVPAHVRNDGHAGKLPVGSLGVEPLEKRTTDERVMAVYNSCVQGQSAAYPAVRDRVGTDVYSEIENAREPRELMIQVSKWTNKNFFSQDTVAGTLTIATKPKLKTMYVSPVNGADYPSPRLEDCTPDTDFGVDQETMLYKRNVKMGIGGNPREVYVARLSWTTEWLGWGKTVLRGGGYIMDDEVIESQGHALVPTAIFANVRMIDLAMPRVGVAIDTFDRNTREFTGRITHKVQGLYSKELRYNLPAYGGEWLRFAEVRLDSNMLGSADCTMVIKDNRIEGKITEGKELGGKNMVLSVDVGGFRVESEPFKIGDDGLKLKTWDSKSGGQPLEHFTYYDVPRKIPNNWGRGIPSIGEGLFIGDATESRFKAMEIAWTHGNKVLHGKYQLWYAGRGELALEAEFSYGVLNGPVKFYNSSSSSKVRSGLHLDGQYRNGKVDGTWRERDFSGQVDRVNKFDAGKFVGAEETRKK